jgi:hypothetical protein
MYANIDKNTLKVKLLRKIIHWRKEKRLASFPASLDFSGDDGIETVSILVVKYSFIYMLRLFF